MGLTIAKFGGTSVGSGEAMQAAASIVEDNPEIRAVVLSAVSGTTNLLCEIGQCLRTNSKGLITEKLIHLHEKHLQILTELDLLAEATPYLDAWYENLTQLVHDFDNFEGEERTAWSDLFLSQGEEISTLIFTILLNRMGIQAIRKDARDWIKTDDSFGRAEPRLQQIRERVRQDIQEDRESLGIFVVQGFVGSTKDGRTTTLGRGGSDFSAALLAEAMGASDLQIWTDVAGVRTMDPRVVENSLTIFQMSFAEAAELANFGAKVLHPATLEPARRSNCRVFIGSTRNPELSGTTISTNIEYEPAVRAIAIRRNQTLITVTSPRMLNTHGFLAQMFAVLARHRVSVDLVTTSEVSVALTIDSASISSEGVDICDSVDFIKELNSLGEVRIESDLSLVALIGNRLQSTPGVSAKTFRAIGSANVRLICQGASSHNLCFLVASEHADSAARALHASFIEEHTETSLMAELPNYSDANVRIYPYEVQS